MKKQGEVNKLRAGGEKGLKRNAHAYAQKHAGHA